MFDLNRTACRQQVYLVVHMVDLSQISSYDIGNIIGKVDVAYRAIIIQEYETLVKNQNSPQTFIYKSNLNALNNTNYLEYS